MNMRVSFGRYGDFWIWSSSISVSASNLQAILYTVVEMELLAPFQYVASSSCSIFHFNIELSHTCQSDDMATLHTPIAILLSHLQALYNNIIILTFIIAISLFLGRRGRRERHCNPTTAPTGGGQKYRKRRSQRGC